MILTNFATCAAPLPPVSAKQCSRCKTRYCGTACQAQHWKEGGHDRLCKKIKKGGGAEQYHADKMYKEAVAIAAEACADDTTGQTCYICTDALHWKTKEGLVRRCACRGTAGFAHVSCLAEQAKILYDEAEENNLGANARNVRWMRWHTCGLCEQRHHGVVWCALGWACWKTYVGLPEADVARGAAMTLLGNGLDAAKHYVDALSVKEARLSLLRRLSGSEETILVVQGNLASTYQSLGRSEQALRLRQEVYSGRVKLNGEEHSETLRQTCACAGMLRNLKRFEEAKSLLLKTMPVAQRVLGDSDAITLKMKWTYAQSLYMDAGATLDDLSEAVTTLEEVDRIAWRVLGGAHPTTEWIEKTLQRARAALRARSPSL